VDAVGTSDATDHDSEPVVASGSTARAHSRRHGISASLRSP
jgi:hypothetical protein